MTDPRRIRLAYFVSHPIQYQAPLLRRIAADPEIDLMVYFTSDFSVRGYLDEGFGVNVTWDTPLLDGYNYEFLPNRLFRKARQDRQISAGIFRRLRQNHFDTVWLHGYSSPNSLLAMIASRALNIPVLLRSDSNLYDRPRSPLKLAFKKAFFQALRQGVRGVLSCGKANRAYWEYYLGGDCPLFNMPYAVDNEFFQSHARQAAAGRKQLRAELGLEGGRPVLLFASKLQTRKRCIDLIDAFRKLGDLPLQIRPYLLIVGDGEERAAIEQRAAGDESIRMLGFRNQSELPRFFDLCDVFVLPSVHEPWGLVVNEAMNAGRAVIVSDQVGCQPDLVFEGINGCVFEALSVDSLAAALRRALISPETTTRMGRDSLRIIEGFSFDNDLAGLREALRRLVPSERVRPEDPGATRTRVSA